MKVAVRFFTKSGNTEKLADAIAEAVGVTAETVDISLPEKVDILFLGSSVYAGGVDNSIKEFIEKNKANIGTIVNFSTAALLPSTFKQVKKIAEQNKVTMCEKEFHCRGSFAFMHRERPNADDLKEAAAFAKSIIK